MNITMYMQVYNSEDYLRKCLDSIVNQTYPVYQFLIVDDGSTDSSFKILQEYEAKYDYIELIHSEKNTHKFWHEVITEKAKGDYFMIIDSDDWLEQDCLEKLITASEKYDYDIVVTGSKFVSKSTGDVAIRRMQEPLILTPENYSDYFVYYHIFFRTYWGKLYKTDVFKKAIKCVDDYDSFYGLDTLLAFYALENSGKVLIDSSCLHNYLSRDDSVSYRYDKRQSLSDLSLLHNGLDFLSKFNGCNPQNVYFLYEVYSRAVRNTMQNLVNAKIEPKEKVPELLKIFARTETLKLFEVETESLNTVKLQWFSLVLKIIAKNVDFIEHFENVLKLFSRDAFSVIKKETAEFFAKDETAQKKLFLNEKNSLSEYIIDLISKNDILSQEYKLLPVLQELTPQGSAVAVVKDEDFIRNYKDVYVLVWNLNNNAAINKMSEILLSGKELQSPEDFLNLFIMLSAKENCVTEFIFGNIQKCYMFIDEKRFYEANEILEDLIQMGLSEDETVIELKNILKDKI